jgi:hypothetical protein
VHSRSHIARRSYRAAARSNVPAFYQEAAFVRDGGLLSYLATIEKSGLKSRFIAFCDPRSDARGDTTGVSKKMSGLGSGAMASTAGEGKKGRKSGNEFKGRERRLR